MVNLKQLMNKLTKEKVSNHIVLKVLNTKLNIVAFAKKGRKMEKSNNNNNSVNINQNAATHSENTHKHSEYQTSSSDKNLL
jgi:hypothetical protein